MTVKHRVIGVCSNCNKKLYRDNVRHNFSGVTLFHLKSQSLFCEPKKVTDTFLGHPIANLKRKTAK